MNSKYIIIITFFFLFNSIALSQSSNELLMRSVSIISSSVNFTNTVIDSVLSTTRVYPPRKIPVRKYLYKCNLIIKLNGDDSLIFSEPIKVKCILPNGHVQEELFNAECSPLNIDKFYDYSFNIISQKRINGWASIELLKYFMNEIKDKTDTIMKYDKATLFIN